MKIVLPVGAFGIFCHLMFRLHWESHCYILCVFCPLLCTIQTPLLICQTDVATDSVPCFGNATIPEIKRSACLRCLEDLSRSMLDVKFSPLKALIYRQNFVNFSFVRPCSLLCLYKFPHVEDRDMRIHRRLCINK